MNKEQALFVLTITLIVLGLIVASILYFQVHPAIAQSLNDCTNEIVGNCTVIR